MQPVGGGFRGWIAMTVRDPRAAARAFADADFPTSVGWMMGAAAVAIFVITNRLMALAVGADPVMAILDEMRRDMGAEADPATSLDALAFIAASSGATFLLVAFAAAVGARIFGGAARPAVALAIAGWWYLLYAFSEGLIALLSLALPGALAVVPIALSLGAMIYLFYALSVMMAEAHGFETPALVFLGGVGVIVAVAIVGSFLVATIVALLAGAS